MIPAIMRKEVAGSSPELGRPGPRQTVRQVESLLIIGFTSAVAAFGAFFIPKSFGTSIAATGGPECALYGFLAFYVSCIGSPGGSTRGGPGCSLASSMAARRCCRRGGCRQMKWRAARLVRQVGVKNLAHVATENSVTNAE